MKSLYKKQNVSVLIKLSLIIISLSFFSCSGKKTEEKKENAQNDTCAKPGMKEISLSKEQYKSADIETATMETKSLHDILKVSGKLDVPPQNLISISAPLSGFLKSTEMLEGLKVKKGQVIAVIEHQDIIQLQQDFIEAKSKFDLAEQELKRQQDLNKENVNSTKVLQQAQNEFTISQVRYKSLEEKIRLAGINKTSILNGNISGAIVITSPINGYVTKVNVNIGKLVTPQDVMFEIIDTEHLHAELVVFEKDIIHLKEGQKVRFNLADSHSKELMATVYLIGRSFDDSRSVRVHCHLDKEDKELLPGMYINAIIELENKAARCVPVESIVRENDKQYIFVKEEEKSCGKHESCNDHIKYCPPEEDCPEHPQCEEHEKCKDKKNCKHKECSAHENCTEQTALAGYKFITIEVKTGATDGKFIEIIPLKEISEDAEIVTKGAFFILSQVKMSGTLDACCQ